MPSSPRTFDCLTALRFGHRAEAAAAAGLESSVRPLYDMAGWHGQARYDVAWPQGMAMSFVCSADLRASHGVRAMDQPRSEQGRNVTSEGTEQPFRRPRRRFMPLYTERPGRPLRCGDVVVNDEQLLNSY